MKKIYISNAVHPNMNYDRSVKSVIWEKFPQIYRLFLDYVEPREHIRVHCQLPAQTFNSLKQCGPDVLERFNALRDKGQLRYMGTHYSEPVGNCMDGMSVLESAELGTAITRRELGDPEGFFLQEIAYHPQMPHIVEKIGVMWTIYKDWDGEFFHPVYLQGQDGTRCIGAPVASFVDLDKMDLNDLPDKTFLMFHNDLEIPETVKLGEELRLRLIDMGMDAQWAFLSDYINEHGVIGGTKSPISGTNKRDASPRATCFSRWISKNIDAVTHEETLKAMEAHRRAGILSIGAPEGAEAIAYPEACSRSYITWDVENPDTYPMVRKDYLECGGKVHPLDRMRHLIAWGSNSDARGWYPLWERTIERRESFQEARVLADLYTKNILAKKSGATDGKGGFYAVNLFPALNQPLTVVDCEPLQIVDGDGEDVVQSIRPVADGFEHTLLLKAQPLSITPLTKRVNAAATFAKATEGAKEVSKGGITLKERAGALVIGAGGREMTVALEPFKICVKNIDSQMRDCMPEGPVRTRVIEGDFPALVIEQQVDWHVHLSTEYRTDGESIFATWRVYFTSEALVDANPPAKPDEMDFMPGGLKAVVNAGIKGATYYDVPFGLTRLGGEETYVCAVTHAFVADEKQGALVSSASGVQSFRLCGDRGEVAVCFGRSITSGPSKKLSFYVGNEVSDVQAEIDWYKEPFKGEYVHRFVVHPFQGGWAEQDIPVKGRAWAAGVQMVETAALALEKTEVLAKVEPDNVMIAGVRVDGTLILNEMSGRQCDYAVEIAGRKAQGRIGAYGIEEKALD